MSLGRKGKLNTGAEIPLLGYGTWQSAPGEVEKGILEALKAGYRHLDLAMIYQNQREVATGLKQAYKEVPGLKREDIFITSKLWNIHHHPHQVEKALDDCLEEIGLDYLDLYLVHWPVAFASGDNLFPTKADGDMEIDDSVSIVDTWKAMTKLSKSKARAIGVSNHSVEHLEALIKGTGVVPAANQIERHPRLPNPKLIDYCAEKGILITAYSAFGNNAFGEPLLVNDPVVKKVAERLSKETGKPVSGAQVILAWSQVGGHSVIPKSVTPSRIRENFQEVELSAEDLTALEALGKEPRRFNVPMIANKPRWNINVFDDPAEKDAVHKVII